MFSIPQSPTPVSKSFVSSLVMIDDVSAIADKPGRFIISQSNKIGGIDGAGFLAEPITFDIDSDIFFIQFILSNYSPYACNPIVKSLDDNRSTCVSSNTGNCNGGGWY